MTGSFGCAWGVGAVLVGNFAWICRPQVFCVGIFHYRAASVSGCAGVPESEGARLQGPRTTQECRTAQECQAAWECRTAWVSGCMGLGRHKSVGRRGSQAAWLSGVRAVAKNRMAGVPDFGLERVPMRGHDRLRCRTIPDVRGCGRRRDEDDGFERKRRANLKSLKISGNRFAV